MYVKIRKQGKENNPIKERTFHVNDYSIEHLIGKKILTVNIHGVNREESYELSSDENFYCEIYIMNELGKTIDHFEC